MKASPGPVFVVGVNGSGTTMLADSLGHHPDLYMFPRETRVLPSLLHKYGALGNLTDENRRALVQELSHGKAFWRENGNKPVILQETEYSNASTAGEGIAAVYLHMAARAGKQHWGDKTPMYVQHMSLMARAFPEARFLHVLRDGRDCAQSFHRRWGLSPLRSVWRWKKAVAFGREQGLKLGPERYMEIKYEDLTSDPERWMREVCHFVQLPFLPAVLKSNMRYFDPNSERAQAGAMVPNSQRWRKYFTGDQIRQLESVAGRMLFEAGYPVELMGDADPASWKLASLKWMDWARMSRSHLQGLRRVAGVQAFFMRAREAVTQDRVNRY